MAGTVDKGAVPLTHTETSVLYAPPTLTPKPFWEVGTVTIPISMMRTSEFKIII